MKIDFSTPISVRGVPVTFAGGEKQGTLGEACNHALNTVPESVRLSLTDMVHRGDLAKELIAGGEQEITPEDAALIRNLLPTSFTLPELVSVLYYLLD